jgi:ribonuclease E
VIATHANPDVPVAVEPDAAPEAEAAPKRTRRRPKARIAEETAATPVVEAARAPEPEPVAVEPAAKPKRSRKKAAPIEAEAEPAITEAPAATVAEVAAPEAEVEAPVSKPKRSRKKAAPADTAAETDADAVSPLAANDADETPVAVDADGAAPADDDALGPDGTPRRGWWQRTFGA